MKTAVLPNWPALIYAQAQLAEGSQLKEPAQYVARLNKLLLDLLQ